MKQYPSISKDILKDRKGFVFSKFDGSNIRAEWNKKKGLYKFGSKTQLLIPEQGIIYKSIDLIKEIEKELSDIAYASKWESCVFFFEFIGEKSFAGNHYEDDLFSIYLIDVNPYKQGILNPSHFVSLFKNYDFMAPLLYEGIIDDDLINKVKLSNLNNMPLEGVVCKLDGKHFPLMFKIKSHLWINKLKEYCNGNTQLYKRLL